MIQTMFTGEESVGAIVTAFPDASNLMKANRIDFCCGGGKKLSEALAEKQIEAAPFMARLNELYEKSRNRPQERDWRTEPLSGLIAHIVVNHHDYLREELPLLAQFVQKIARVHGPGHTELIELAELYDALQHELTEHLAAEEKEVFPLIELYERTGSEETRREVAAVIERMEAEHEAAGDLLRRMREVTRDYDIPVDACRTYTIAFQKLVRLEADMFEHIHLENNILFQRICGGNEAVV